MSSLIRRVLLGAATLLVVLVAASAVLVATGVAPVANVRALFDFLLGRGIEPPSTAAVTERLHVPAGFQLQLYSSDVPLARVVLATTAGDLIVSRSRADTVSVVERDRDGDGVADGQRTLLEGLDGPHGLALLDDWLYVAERTAIGRARFDVVSGKLAGPYEHILTGLTKDGQHVTKTLGVGPDGWLYLSQGSTCNVCIETDPRRATMMRLRPDGSGAEVYATGLRNSVGFDWAPWDGGLYATENGRDLLGDDFPPDELNRIEQGGFYGWPHVNGFGVPDPDFGDRAGSETFSHDPVHAFRPHNAPLGVHFLRNVRVPPGYERTALVALHGSWNRRTPDGYKVVALRWGADGSIAETDFLTGFLSDDGLIGRPAFVTEGPDGSIYVSDDYAGVIYRISAAP